MTTVKQPLGESSKRIVSYYYDARAANAYYGPEHVMKPHRIKMAHELILQYRLYPKLHALRPWSASATEMTEFHTMDYIEFLKNSSPDKLDEYSAEDLAKYNFAADCPIFEGLFDFCSQSCGGSLAGALKLNKREADIAINWMGGLHHAKRGEASGFCYTNDIVLAILELLKHHTRVLYIDIDVHHGDGVEEAFYTTDRVMTVSFHRHGDGFFPSTGDVKSIGAAKGRLYSLNVPLRSGITDEVYKNMFQPIMAKVMERFRPDAIVLQCGADSLVGDRLGTFNLTTKGHGDCVKFMRSYNVPLMLLGGGGYTPRNVARVWAYETAVALDVEIGNDLPYNRYWTYLGPSTELHLKHNKDMHDDNREAYLTKIKAEVMANLAALTVAPSVQMQPIPAAHPLGALIADASARRDAADPDERLHDAVMDDAVPDQGEYYDGEEGEDGERNEHNAKEDGSGSDDDDEEEEEEL